MLREGVKNIQRGGCTNFAPFGRRMLTPPIFGRSHLDPPKMQVLSETTPKKQKKLQIYSIIRPYLMKNVDPPPILATLFSKQQIPPHIRVKFKETPPQIG